MSWLLAGIVVFFGVHLIPSRPRLRQNLVHAIGEMPYKGVFAILSFAGLALIIKGMIVAPPIPLWHPPPSAKMATAIFMAPALILLAASPAQIIMGKAMGMGMSMSAGNIARIVRHPMSLGVLLWSLSHLLANGTLASLLLFGSFALFALYDMHDMRSTTTPPAAAKAPASIKSDVLAGVIGMAAYFLLIAFHATLFGVAVFCHN